LSEAVELTRATGDEKPEIVRNLVHYLRLAGQHASHLDTKVAEGYFRRAIDLLEEDELECARVLSDLAAVMAQRGQLGEAIALNERAIPVLREGDTTASAAALRRLSTAMWLRGDADRARELVFEAIALLEDDPGPELVAAYGTAAHRAAISGRLDQAAGLADEGLALAAELGVDDVMSLLMARASVLGYSGDPETVVVSRAARDLGLRLGIGRATAVATNNLAEALFVYETVGAGLDMWDQAISFSRSRGIEEAVMWQRGERLKGLYHAGAWDELVETGTAVGDWAGTQGAGQLEIVTGLALCDVLVHRGGLDEASQRIDVLLPKVRESGDPQVVVPGLTMAAVVASARGDAGAALRCLAELEASTREATAWRSFCLPWAERIARTSGAPHLVETLLDGVVAAPGWNSCAIQSASAALVEARGHAREAAALYRDAADRWRVWGSVVERAYALLGSSRCGDAEAGAEAATIFARLGARPVLARAA
jgi:tetratricopeptide (TPR) repeat protein